MQKCMHCKVESEDGLTTDDGEFVCDRCTFNRCSQCLKGHTEVETRNGDYICFDCHSGNVDATYEYNKDLD